jgi:very-short-patch-repair endonuclease
LKPRNTEIARKLRKNLTDAEKYLWKRLRFKQLAGLKFRRQQPIGNYIVDFVCFERRIAIEIDGGQHAEDHKKSKDIKRDSWLRQQGFKVLRFWNNEALKNINGVLEVIMKEFLSHPPLTPARTVRRASHLPSGNAQGELLRDPEVMPSWVTSFGKGRGNIR